MYKKIMVPLDGSELAECVFPHVEAIANGCTVVSVVFVRVVEPFYLPSGYHRDLSDEEIKKIDARNRTNAKDYLDEMMRRVKLGVAEVETEVIVGKAAESLADYATHNDVDLIIISTHGRSGVSRWVLGSVADRTLRSACIPVLMVRAPGCIPGILG